MKLGVVADDLTGSTDIGVMFAKHRYAAEIYTYRAGREDLPSRLAASTADILILNTNARLLERELAYQAAGQAARLLQQAGARQFFNKTCSVFRGPVGPYFDGMLDALGQDFGLVVLGFPKNGRITRDGIHYVHGKRLEESEFRHDPIHPMTRSNLVEILQSQTRRQVGLVPHPVVDQGPGALRAEIDARRKDCQYLIVDVTGQEALAAIARAAPDLPVYCGSSALAEELPAVWGPPVSRASQVRLPPDQGLGVLVAAGSLMPQTRSQLSWLRQAGLFSEVFPAGAILDSGQRTLAVAQAVEALAGELQAGRDVVFCMPNDPPAVAGIQAAASRAGLTQSEAGNLVSQTLAEVVGQVVARTGLARLVVAGGETSSAVCERLGVSGLRVWQEIEPGLPSCISLDGPPRLLVLKSGSFGRPEFLMKAIQHLRENR